MSERNYFNPISPRVDFVKLEEEILAYWQRQSIENKYLQKNRQSPRYFSFLDGPITANNPMGVHHAWGRTYKDLWQRYKNMRGFQSSFIPGWDCHGLPVENEIEKAQNLTGAPEIEKFGIAKYTAVEAFETKATGGALSYILDRLPKAQSDAAFLEMTLSDKDGLTYLINQPDESAIVMSFGVLCPWLQQHENATYYRFLAREIYRVTPQGGISVHVVNSGGGWEEMFSTAGFDTIPSRTSHHIIVQKPHTT